MKDKVGRGRSWWRDLQIEMEVWRDEKGEESELGKKSPRLQADGGPQSKGFLLGVSLTYKLLDLFPPLCSIISWEQRRKNILLVWTPNWIQKCPKWIQDRSWSLSILLREGSLVGRCSSTLPETTVIVNHGCVCASVNWRVGELIVGKRCEDTVWSCPGSISLQVIEVICTNTEEGLIAIVLSNQEILQGHPYFP